MSILTYRFKFTTYNFENGMRSTCVCWCKRFITFKKAADYHQIRMELLETYPNDPDIQKGVLLHAELAGIRIFGIRVI